jgi:LPS-assembly protein
MRSQLQLVITTCVLCHLLPGAAQVTSQAPPATGAGSSQQLQEQGATRCHAVLTAPPKTAGNGGARTTPKIAISQEEPVDITARECEKTGDIYTLRGAVEIKFETWVFRGDHVTYNSVSGDAKVTGHATLDGGPRDMHIAASHGEYNIRSQTGKLYDVTGTTGARFRGNNVTLTSSNPIAFTATEVDQTGPEEYLLHHGTVTSCEVPHPKWRFHAARIILRVGNSAKVYNSTFRLKGIPVIYLPYVAPPVERLGRQTGFLIPTPGYSGKKGFTLADSFYWAINRSMDATLGSEYMSRRGWMLVDNFRARPSQKSFLNVSYFQVLDRGVVVPVTNPDGSPVIDPATGQPVLTRQNQGGEDIKLNGETTFAHEVRGVASLEYLSKFVFRTQFSPTFSQAIDSEVRSVAFVSKSIDGYSFNGATSRYQNFQSTTPGDVITIVHTPGLEVAGVDHRVLRSSVYWSYDAAIEGLHRSEPSFFTHGVVWRSDINPALALPLFLKGWTFRPEAQLQDTYYTQQQVQGPTGLTSVLNDINRRAITASVEMRPPLLDKVFTRTFAGRQVKHVIEPWLVYRYTNGVENFGSIIHFDYRDILSNTHEVGYGLVHRFYLKRARPGNCGSSPQPETQASAAQRPAGGECVPAGADEFLTWEVKQKYFIDPNFGGAIVEGRRNVLATTVDFTGIAFLTEPRKFSPIVSRLRMRTSSNSDLEWQLDYDTKKGRINASTLYTRFHFGDLFLEGRHAFLEVPGEIVFTPATPTQPPVQLPPCAPGGLNPTSCVPQEFNQVRARLGYGDPKRRGWSVATDVGYDFEFKVLQYGSAVASYNWDCCGITLEYGRFSLSNVRNEPFYKFSFSLANIASFGNLRKQDRLF